MGVVGVRVRVGRTLQDRSVSLPVPMGHSHAPETDDDVLRCAVFVRALALVVVLHSAIDTRLDAAPRLLGRLVPTKAPLPHGRLVVARLVLGRVGRRPERLLTD